MEFFFKASPLIWATTGALAVVIILLWRSDARQSQLRRHLYRKLFAKAMRQNAKKISVIIELNRRADSIFPLLEHLYSKSYRKLEVCIIIKHTAGPRAHSVLLTHRRKHRYPNLRLFKHKKGMDRHYTAKRVASGDAIIWLDSSARISNNFFEESSLHLIDPAIDAILPKQLVRVDNTIASALQAIIALFATLLHSSKVKSQTSGPIADTTLYRRLSLTRPMTLLTLETQRLFVTKQPMTMSKFIAHLALRPKAFAASLAAASIIVVTGFVLGASSVALLSGGLIVVFGYTLAIIFLICSTKNYSLTTKFTIILLAPIGIPLLTLLNIYSYLQFHIRTYARSTERTSRKPTPSSHTS